MDMLSSIQYNQEKKGIMIIDYTKPNQQAVEIYKLIKKNKKIIESRVREDGRDSIIQIGNFVNGREKGYTLRRGVLEVSFAECRCTDAIVVYPFSWDSKGAEADYESKTQFFKVGEFQKVFKFLMEFLEVKI